MYLRRFCICLYLISILCLTTIAVEIERVSKDNFGARKTGWNTQQYAQIFKPAASNITKVELMLYQAAGGTIVHGDPEEIPVEVELFAVSRSFEPSGRPLAKGTAVPSKDGSKSVFSILLNVESLDVNKYYALVITAGDGDNNWRLALKDAPESWDKNERAYYKVSKFDFEWVKPSPVSLCMRIYSLLPPQPPSVKSHLWPLSWGGPYNEELYWAKDLVHRQLVQYINEGDRVGENARLVIDLPKGIEILVSVMTDDAANPERVFTNRVEEQIIIDDKEYVRYNIPMFDIKEWFVGGQNLWGQWPGWWCYLMVRPKDIHEGKYNIYWYIEGDNFKEEKNQAVLNILPPVPKAEVGKKVYIGYWMYRLNWYIDDPTVDEALMDTLKHIGVKKITHAIQGRWAIENVVNRAVKLAHERDMLVLGESWWNYLYYAPTEPKSVEARAMNINKQLIPGVSWNPTYIVEKGSEWQEFLSQIKNLIQDYDLDGFMHDYEGSGAQGYQSTLISFDEKSKKAFLEYTGLKDLNWPLDVGPNGRYQKQWIEFRNWQNALYVKTIADAVREVKQNALTQTWSDGYFEPYMEHWIYLKQGSDITQFSRYLSHATVGTYVFPSDISKLPAVEGQIEKIKSTIDKVERGKIIPCVSLSHTLGDSITPLASVDLIRYQALRHLMDGAAGFDFWGLGHIEDGRYYHLVSYLSTIFAKTECYIMNGNQVNPFVIFSGKEEKANIHVATWEKGDSYLVIIANGNNESKKLTINVTDKSYQGKSIQGLFNEDYGTLGQEITIEIPAFDAAFFTIY